MLTAGVGMLGNGVATLASEDRRMPLWAVAPIVLMIGLSFYDFDRSSRRSRDDRDDDSKT